MKHQFRNRRFIGHVAILLCALLVLRSGRSQDLGPQPDGSSRFANSADGNQLDSATPREDDGERTAFYSAAGPASTSPYAAAKTKDKEAARDDSNANQRIVTIRVGNVPSMLKAEMQVDLHATFKPSKGEGTDRLTTETVAENVKVFAVDRRTDGSPLSLLVSREQAKKLITASEFGRLSLSIVHEPSGRGATYPGITAIDDGVVLKLHQGSNRLTLRVKSSKIVAAPHQIPRALVNNPEIVSAIAISPNQLQISALKPGVTQLNLWDEDTNLYTIDVVVHGDARELEMLLETEFPNASIRVRPLKTSVVLSGRVDGPEVIDRVVRMAEDYYPKVINNLNVDTSDGAEVGKATGEDDRSVAQLDQPMETKPQPDVMKSLHHDVIQLRHEVRQLIELLEKQVSRDRP